MHNLFRVYEDMAADTAALESGLQAGDVRNNADCFYLADDSLDLEITLG